MNAKRAVLVYGFVLVSVAVIACGGYTAKDAANDTSRNAPSFDTQTEGTNATQSATNIDARLVITSSIDLEVNKLRDAYISIGDIARSYGGFVADASIVDSERDSTASIRLRVPAVRHDELLGSLRTFRESKVRREETNAKEVTAEYTDLESRLRNLQRNEAQYQQLLTQAKTIDEIINVNNRLQGVRGEIEQAQGRLNLLGNLTEMATINVALTQPVVAPTRGSLTPGDVFAFAVDGMLAVSLALLNVAIVVAVVVGWTAPFGLAGLIAWKVVRRYLPSLKSRLL